MKMSDLPRRFCYPLGGDPFSRNDRNPVTHEVYEKARALNVGETVTVSVDPGFRFRAGGQMAFETRRHRSGILSITRVK
jgi:hypothetical protein